MKDKMIVMAGWIKSSYDKMSDEDFNVLAGQILRKGIFEEEVEETGLDSVDMLFSLISPQIDNMQNEYEKKIVQGKKGGRPSKVDNERVWRMLNEEGKKSSEIIKELGIAKSTFYDCEGYVERNNPDYIKKYEN